MAGRMEKETRLLNIIESLSQMIMQVKIAELEKIDATDLTLAQFQYIDVINDIGNPTFTYLAERLNISKPAVTAIINNLIQKKMVSKKQSEDDRRRFHIHLTGDGKKVAQAYRTALRTFAGHIRDSLTECEFDQLLVLLEKSM